MRSAQTLLSAVCSTFVLCVCGFALSACGSGTGGGGADHAGSSGNTGQAGGTSTSGGASTGGSSSSGGGNAAGGAVSGTGGSVNGSTGGASTGGSGTIEPPGIQYFGRWDTSDPQNPSGSWGPIGLKAKFEGTSVSIKLNDTANSFTYSIDGGAMQTLGPGAPAQAQLAVGLSDAVHTLEFFRRSEGGFGKTVVSGLVLDAGKNVLSPDLRPARKIEVVGDSISAGYGNEGGGGNTPQNQNGYMAFGPQLARMLDAQWSIIAHSGQGIYKNGCEPVPPTGPHMPDEFKLTNHPFVSGPEWDFSKWQPDVLIIALGTNDYANYSCMGTPLPEDGAFKQAYTNFLSFARSKYPQAHVFALGTFIAASSNQFGQCNKNICDAVAAMNDERLHCIDPGFTSASGAWLPDGTYYVGDWTHPTIQGHTIIANRLRSIIAPILGW